MYHRYERTGFSHAMNPNDTENTQKVDKALYFQVGRNALDLCVNALLWNDCEIPKTILDMPSGSGRVLRHLTAYFKDSEVHASDLYEHHLNFCKEEFGVHSILATNDNQHALCAKKYDLIFVGSLLTHLPLSGFKSVLDFIANNLANKGIALITFEGRFSIFAQQKTNWKFVSDELFDVAYQDYLKHGFGFVDYNQFEEMSYKQDNYGFALSSPSFVIQQIFAHEGLRLLSYKEQAWNNHQDCCVIQKIDGYLQTTADV